MTILYRRLRLSDFTKPQAAKSDPMKNEVRSVSAAVMSALAALPW
ncbi:MAG TPA: hypothetical protein VH643_02625 [Gemmataceae bacterium]|jgi:hypothetical protein